ncbi:MAG: hypothetical protein ACFE9T_05345 [Promethearchaeota archaeon]
MILLEKDVSEDDVRLFILKNTQQHQASIFLGFLLIFNTGAGLITF